MSWTRLEHMTGGTPLPGRAEAPAKYRLRTLGWRGPGRRKESWLRLEARPNTAPASAAGGEEARAGGGGRGGRAAGEAVLAELSAHLGSSRLISAHLAPRARPYSRRHRAGGMTDSWRMLCCQPAMPGKRASRSTTDARPAAAHTSDSASASASEAPTGSGGVGRRTYRERLRGGSDKARAPKGSAASGGAP